MRLLIAGLVCLALGIGLTEYFRRHPTEKTEAPADGAPAGKKKPKLSSAQEKLLTTAPPGSEPRERAPELQALLQTPGTDSLEGFVPVATGKFEARELRGGFGAALFVMDVQGASAVVRAAQGEPAEVILSRKGRIDALAVDGSTVFCSAEGVVLQLYARGDEPLTVRARFPNARVTSIAAAGDTLVLTLVPRDGDGEGLVVALDNDGAPTVLGKDQTQPRAARTDGKDAYWVSGETPALWRGALDGAFASQLIEPADSPLALDGDGVYYRAPLGTGTELRRVGRAGGKLQTLITADVGYLAVSSGLIRVATMGQGAGLLELTGADQAKKLLDLPGTARGLAIAGNTLYLLTERADGRTTLHAR